MPISPADICSDRFVFLTDDQFERVERNGALDTAMYGWGHAGPCYYRGRIVIRALTLGG